MKPTAGVCNTPTHAYSDTPIQFDKPMPPRPFLLRLIAPFAVMIVLVVTVCGFVIYWAGQRTVHLQQIRDLDRLTGLVRQWLDPSSATQHVSAQQLAQIRSAAQVLDTRITLVAGDG